MRPNSRGGSMLSGDITMRSGRTRGWGNGFRQSSMRDRRDRCQCGSRTRGMTRIIRSAECAARERSYGRASAFSSARRWWVKLSASRSSRPVTRWYGSAIWTLASSMVVAGSPGSLRVVMGFANRANRIPRICRESSRSKMSTIMPVEQRRLGPLTRPPSLRYAQCWRSTSTARGEVDRVCCTADLTPLERALATIIMKGRAAAARIEPGKRPRTALERATRVGLGGDESMKARLASLRVLALVAFAGLLLFTSPARSVTVQEVQALESQYNELYAAKKYREAVPVAEQLAEGVRKLLGPRHATYTAVRQTLAHAYNNAGLAYQSEGAFPEAEKYYKRALELREQVYPANHPETAQSCDNLGTINFLLGRYQEALALHSRALAIRQKIANLDPVS